MKSIIRNSTLVIGVLATGSVAQASTDYGPAIWRPLCQANWYTSGFGHKFHVCHDMEGYYASTVSWFSSCGMTSASVHYAINGLQDASSDAPAGEITQLGVTEANYAWHALCWNQHSTGTEHEGFASNPAWYTDAMYNASGPLSRHEGDKFGYLKDRNHIIAHGQKSVPGWSAWASANLGIDPNCNTHTDPGPYWDWTKYMAIINPVGGTIVDNGSGSFSASAAWATGSSATDRYGADYRYHSTAASSDPAVWNISFGSAGTHTVFVWYPQGSNRSTTASYLISTSAGSHTEVVNQQITGGQWVNQGAYSMNAGANTVKLSFWTTTGFIVVADAVQWQ